MFGASALINAADSEYDTSDGRCGPQAQQLGQASSARARYDRSHQEARDCPAEKRVSAKVPADLWHDRCCYQAIGSVQPNGEANEQEF